MSKAEGEGEVTAKKAGTRKLTPRQTKFVEGVVRHGNKTKAAREAGYSDPNANASKITVKNGISEAIERRQAAAMRRAQIHTDVIVGGLAEVMTASLGDVLDEQGNFSLEAARANGVDHLVKKLKTVVFDTKDKDGNVTSTRTTHEYEMYSRLDAMNQLRDTFGLKQEARRNTVVEIEQAIRDFQQKARALGHELSDEEARAYVEPRLVSRAIN